MKRAIGLALAVAGGISMATAQPADRSGVYKSRIGELSLLEVDNALLFSYEAAFGNAPNLCDWGAVARRDADNRFTTKDESGIATFAFSAREITFDMANGTPDNCGAGWPGDRFPIASRVAPDACMVAAPRATFFDIQTRDALKTDVVAGDRVDVVPSQQVEGEPYLLARFTGPKSRTLGLLKKTDLKCPR